MRKYAIRITVMLILSIAGTQLLATPGAEAANKADFNPGYIIDDYVFYNANAMNATQIQNFLTAKNPKCDYDGTQPASDWGYPNLTHAQVAEYKRNGTNGFSKDAGFHAPPYRCLPKYVQDTPQMEASSGYCSTISAGKRTAAEIINDVAKACGINPQVLIVLLEKEQSLVTDSWPLDRQLRHATGFACPDTAPCDPAYEGFFYQVYNAARQFKVYQAFPNSYNYRAGRNNNIYWNPDLSRCGSSTVYIQNQATAGLYIYTPYRPNQAALDNLYGTGDSCSAYGNRNFWRIFTDWFGNTKTSYVPFDEPRWMELKTEQTKVTPGLNQPWPGEQSLPAGTQLRFTSKIWANDQWYYRTEQDSAQGLNRGIPQSAVQDIAYVSFEVPRWMAIARKTQKIQPRTSEKVNTTLNPKLIILFVDKIQVNGEWYYRTEYDQKRNNHYGIKAGDITEATFTNFETPRWMRVSTEQKKIDPIRNTPTDQTISAGTNLKFSKKITLGEATYYQAETDNGTSLALESNGVTEITYSPILSNKQSKWVKLNKTTKKIDPATGALYSQTFKKDLEFKISEEITLDGTTYFRTEHDKTSGTSLAFAASDIAELPYTSLDEPRNLKLLAATKKYNPKTGQTSTETHEKGSVYRFTTKILVGGTWYLRTESDTNNSLDLAIPRQLLGEL